MKQSTAVQRARARAHLRLVSSDQIFDRMRETYDAIARRAFEIFEGNGRRFGRDLEDWFRAERELLHPVHMEISETEGDLTVVVEVPGFTEKDIEIHLEPRRLTISGTRESTEEHKKGKTVYTERCSNRIFRVVDLPAQVDATNAAVQATYDKGILTITLPKPVKQEGRQIKVEAKPAQSRE
jgi:HSP20 family protein